ncbi:MAG TPA: type II secretion system F family protein [Anaerohalosphaeraceae bacterium]|nr:type II secretion system F family protein [Anaerohalosphaeraceae bacterium]HOL88880.1 type II secretion system F family protein [Anaerohalosphaeraceae bacterium]HPP55722.1 type II secretion system F family protein [Anaerohalosphaeraceae bacterium]
MADPKIQFYHSLSTLLGAGVPILRALPLSSRVLRGSWRRMAQSLDADIRKGMSLADSLARRKRYFEPLEIELVRTGEETGQLAEILEQLSQWREFLRQIKRTFWSGMALPIVYIHAAALVLPLQILGKAILLKEGEVTDYFYAVAGILSVFYIPAALTAAAVYLTPSQGFFRKMYDSALCAVPVMGKAVINLSLSRFAKTFAMLYGAGVPIVQASEQALRNCGNWLVQQRLKGGCLNVRKGLSMSAGFAPTMDAEFREIWLVGEETGELEESAQRLGKMYAERAETSIRVFARTSPVLIYMLIMGVLAFLVVQGFLSIYGTVLSQ